jgi:hypothetical protein
MKPPKGKPRELCPEGTHQAQLISIIDIGTQEPNTPGFNKSRRVYFNFEVTEPRVKKEDGSPFFLRRDYTFSERSKNLLKDLKGWLNVKTLVDYDIDNALTKHAMLKVTHSDDGQYDNITNISEVPKGLKTYKATTAPMSFYLDEFDEDVFKTLPQWIQEKIVKSDEYPEIMEAKIKDKKSSKEKAAPAAKGKKK